MTATYWVVFFSTVSALWLVSGFFFASKLAGSEIGGQAMQKIAGAALGFAALG